MHRTTPYALALLVCFPILTFAQKAAGSKPHFSLKEAERLSRLSSATLNASGDWVGYFVDAPKPIDESKEEKTEARRRRGRDRSLVLRNVKTSAEHRDKKATRFSFSPDGQWVLITSRPEPPKKDKPKEGKTAGKPEIAPTAKEVESGQSPSPVAPAKTEKKEAQKPTEPVSPEKKEPTEQPGKQEAPEGEGAKVQEPSEQRGRRGRRRGGRFGGRRRSVEEQGGATRRRGRRGPGETHGNNPQEKPESKASSKEASKKPEFKPRGNHLELRHLNSGATRTLPHVESFHFTKDGKELVFYQSKKEDACGIYALDLSGDANAEPEVIHSGVGRVRAFRLTDESRYVQFWSNLRKPEPKVEQAEAVTEEPKPASAEEKEQPESASEPSPAAKEGPVPASESKKPKPTEGAKPATAEENKVPEEHPFEFYVFDRESRSLERIYGEREPGMPEGWEAEAGSRIEWAKDRSFFDVRLRKIPEKVTKSSTEGEEAGGMITLPNGRQVRSRPRFSRSRRTPREAAKIDDKKSSVKVWHWKDDKVVPMVNGRQGQNSNESRLHRVNLVTGEVTPLETDRIRGLRFDETRRFALASDNKPYQAARTWDRGYQDWFLIDCQTGARRALVRKHPGFISWIAEGRFVAWEEDGTWQVMSPEDAEPRDLLAATPIPQNTETNRRRRSGGFGRLLPGEREILFSDGYDLWAIPLDASPGRNLTENGRQTGRRYRQRVFNSDDPFDGSGTLWLTFTNTNTIAQGVAKLDLESSRMTTCMRMNRSIGSITRAKSGDRCIFTLESSDLPADLWAANGDFESVTRLTDLNPWVEDYLLPRSELVRWHNSDGVELKGIVTYPPEHKWDPRPRPTIVYIYEELSQGLHRFSRPGLQLSPARWAQEGYVVFRPDIIYDMGHPGDSSVKCVVPGVQKLIDLGITDPKRVGLCGHSWGGYETAYIITQTKLFSAAIAGAPVVNMTSAYNGIRWSSGLPRQFQYERTQSRIGGSLWEYPERYIENSPVFHLENVTTPVLIMFGNNDGAVPWYQGIEYYLAMRRLDKEAIFLEYQGEDHGLRRKPNQEDYTKRITEWFAHHLKGADEPEWMVGEPDVDPLPELHGQPVEVLNPSEISKPSPNDKGL